MPMGMAYISSYLKSKGIETYLWDNTFESIKELVVKVFDIKPDFICFGALSPDYKYACELARFIKKTFDIPIIIGGPHATFATNEIMADGVFDVAVRGDGEYILYNYIMTQDPHTPGTWVRKNDVIYMNPMGELPDVDKLPWPDHEMFKRHSRKIMAWDKSYKNVAMFITARGCPFKCTYCGCNNLHKIYKGQQVTRFRNIDDVISEIKTVTSMYQNDLVWLTDETFTMKKARILEFCKKYNSIGLPFAIETRADTVNEEILRALKKAGCVLLCMGIESGVDRIRNDLYKKNVSREKLIDAFKLAKKIGLRTSSFNICGGPTETADDIRETIKLNKECEVDIGKMTIFNAFPGSELTKWCKDNGYYIRDNYPKNYYVDSNIKHDTLSIDELVGLRKEFVEAMGGFTGSEVEGVV
jgi:radical SAM superfamily enzyme YgiQ (UPF0313 family)